MPPTEPSGAPAASDAAGLQPTTSGDQTTTNSPAAATTPVTPAASSGDPSAATTDIRDPAAKAAADEAARYRKALRDAERRIADFEAAKKAEDDAKLSETQRLQKQLSELQLAQVEKERKSQERVIRAEVRAQAATAGVPADLASKLIDYAEIEFDDDGEPKNIAKLLDALVKQYPQLAAVTAATTTAAMAGKNGAGAAQPTSVGVTPANPPRSAAGSSGAVTEAYVASLTPQQYANLPPERRQEVQQWMAQQAIRK